MFFLAVISVLKLGEVLNFRPKKCRKHIEDVKLMQFGDLTQRLGVLISTYNFSLLTNW